MNTHTATDICGACSTDSTDTINWHGDEYCRPCFDLLTEESTFVSEHTCTCCERPVAFTSMDDLNRGVYTDDSGVSVAWCERCNTESCSYLGANVCARYQGPTFQCEECWEYSRRDEAVEIPNFGLLCNWCFAKHNA